MVGGDGIEPPTSNVKLAAALGLAGIILIVFGGGALHGTPPAFDAPLQQIRDSFRNGGQAYLVGDYLARLGFVFGFLPFVVALRGRLAAAAAEPRILSWLIVVGGVATFAVGDAAKFFLNGVALAGGSSEISDSTLRTLLYLDSEAISTIGAPASTCFGLRHAVTLKSQWVARSPGATG